MLNVVAIAVLALSAVLFAFAVWCRMPKRSRLGDALLTGRYCPLAVRLELIKRAREQGDK